MCCITFVSVSKSAEHVVTEECGVQAYDCDAASIRDGKPVSKTVACSYDPNFKGFCTEPEEVSGVQAWTMSHFVAPLRALGSCQGGPISPVRTHLLCHNK
jgi:hypothetical protein